MEEDRTRQAEPSETPFLQRVYDRPLLLLVLGLAVMLLVYTAWGILEVMTLPEATLP
jgi:hypothetical protein